MAAAPGDLRLFERLKPDLVKHYPGQFAVICRGRLLGIFESVDDALMTSSQAFDDGSLPEGAAVLISEIADRVSVRVTATPHPRLPPTGAGFARA